MQFYSKFALIISSLLNSNLELTQALEQNRKVINNLKRSNKDLERFAYVSSHDLKEPLRMISSYVQLFLYKYESKFDESGKKYADFIVEGVRRMYQLIEDLVKYSYLLKSDSDSFEIIDCDKLIRDVLSDLSILISENKATVQVHPITNIYANPTQLRLLFQNLIQNAIKFRSKTSPEIFISFTDLPDYWQFAISDNGIGIDSRYSETIFDLFSRINTREKYNGSGIGLAECRRIAENHGGRIWVESEAEKGSVFRFSIKKSPR